MGWIDDLQMRASQAEKQASLDINSWLTTQAVDAVVSIGSPNNGNLSVADIAQGKHGELPPLAKPVTDPALLNNARQASGFIMQNSGSILMIVIVVAAVVLLGKKGRK